ncbi:MAG TPA: hypothetical protein VF316_07235, partial [Polyangiaceae bacterium]
MNRTLVSLAALVLLACQHTTAPDPAEVAIQAEPTVAAVDAGVPLADHDWLEPVGDDARELAKVSVPLGATTQRPVMV